MELLNFEEQFTSYGKYHQNKINKILHVICIPLITWTCLVWMSYIPAIKMASVLNLRVSYMMTTAYALYYLLLDPVAGALYAPVLFGLAYLALEFQSNFYEQAAHYAAYLHVCAWIVQFIGHGVFEKKAPALFDGLIKTLLFAPLFAFLEILFLLGYRPALRQRTAERIQKLTDKEGLLKE